MARKQVGLKLEEEDLIRWDAFAESQGWTRTELIETAIERLIAATGIPGSISKHTEDELERVPAESQPQKSTHEARPGIRRAYICRHKDCNRRTFLEPEELDHTPDCPEHGRMERQENKPYFGQSTK